MAEECRLWFIMGKILSVANSSTRFLLLKRFCSNTSGLVDYAGDFREVTLIFSRVGWKYRVLTISRVPLVAAGLAVTLASWTSSAQTRAREFTSLTSSDSVFRVRYPKSLLVCSHRDGENPDEWSPQDCAADIPVCDNSGHAGNVILCLAAPTAEFQGSELQAAAFSVSRIDNLTGAKECLQKWPRADTSDIHSEAIGGLRFQAAKANETGNNRIAEQHIYRIFHKTACYELDVNLTVALDTAFASEDKPRKLSPAERHMIEGTLMKAVSGFRFLK